MIAIINIKAELERLRMLEGRSPTSTPAEKEGAIVSLARFRDGAIFAAKFAGTSDWERHPQGDEIVEIIDGATMLHLISADGRRCVTLTAGMMVIVPQNTWHRFEAPGGVCLLTATPQPTDHAGHAGIDAEDA
jgi:mannose-6-phosphate isomerase-like protein (cupin superfamily)